MRTARLFTILGTYIVCLSTSPPNADGVAVAFWLAVLSGMWFFQRWARLIFVVFLPIALLTIPFRMHRYSLSSPPPLVAPVGAFILLLTGAILAMCFLPPVRDCFATKEA